MSTPWLQTKTLIFYWMTFWRFFPEKLSQNVEINLKTSPHFFTCTGRRPESTSSRCACTWCPASWSSSRPRLSRRAGSAATRCVLWTLKFMIALLWIKPRDYHAASSLQGDTSAPRPGSGWLWFYLFHCLPSSVWADENWAEVAVQDGETP